MCQKPDTTKAIAAWCQPRIEGHQARIAVKLERARGAFGRKEAQRRGDVLAEPVDTHADGELGTVGLDRVFEQDIEQLLVPVEVQIVGEAGRRHVLPRVLI